MNLDDYTNIIFDAVVGCVRRRNTIEPKKRGPKKGHKWSPEILAARVGKKRPSRTSELMGIARKLNWQNPIYRHRQETSLALARQKKLRSATENRFETLISFFLTEAGIKFDRHVLIENTAVDYQIIDSNVIIEAYGCYWHGCPTHFPDRNNCHDLDARNSVKFDRLGYNVLRIWEHETWDVASLSSLKAKIFGLVLR